MRYGFSLSDEWSGGRQRSMVTLVVYSGRYHRGHVCGVACRVFFLNILYHVTMSAMFPILHVFTPEVCLIMRCVNSINTNVPTQM
jgi:hypothetical protein